MQLYSQLIYDALVYTFLVSDLKSHGVSFSSGLQITIIVGLVENSAKWKFGCEIKIASIRHTNSLSCKDRSSILSFRT